MYGARVVIPFAPEVGVCLPNSCTEYVMIRAIIVFLRGPAIMDVIGSGDFSRAALRTFYGASCMRLPQNTHPALARRFRARTTGTAEGHELLDPTFAHRCLSLSSAFFDTPSALYLPLYRRSNRVRQFATSDQHSARMDHEKLARMQNAVRIGELQGSTTLGILRRTPPY